MFQKMVLWTNTFQNEYQNYHYFISIISKGCRIFCWSFHLIWPKLQLYHPTFFFFSFGTFGPDRMGLTAPSEYGIAKGQLIFSFRSRTVSLRLPGSLTTPFGGGITPLRGVITRRLMRAHACELQFWPVWTSFRSFCAAGLWPKLCMLFFSYRTPMVCL